MNVFNDAASSPMRPPGIFPSVRALVFQFSKSGLDSSSLGPSLGPSSVGWVSCGASSWGAAS